MVGFCNRLSNFKFSYNTLNTKTGKVFGYAVQLRFCYTMHHFTMVSGQTWFVKPGSPAGISYNHLSN